MMPRVECPLCPDHKLQEREPLWPGSEKWAPVSGSRMLRGVQREGPPRDGGWVVVA